MCVILRAASAALMGLLLSASTATAQQGAVEGGSNQALQDQVNTANNPLADLVSISLHNYYFPRLNGVPNDTANTFWLRLVTPFWRVIPRLSMPIEVVPATNPDETTAKVTGFGDLNIFATFVVTPDDASAIVGVGPIYTAPTASNDALGSGKHEVGIAALTVYAKGILLTGALVNYQIGVAGDSSKPRTQYVVAQPLVFFQLGKGYYLRSAPIWFFDIEKPTYNVPFGLGAGKVIPTEKVVFNIFIEPQFAIALRGIGQPAIQVFAGLNMQLKTRRKRPTSETARLVNQLRAERTLRASMR